MVNPVREVFKTVFFKNLQIKRTIKFLLINDSINCTKFEKNPDDSTPARMAPRRMMLHESNSNERLKHSDYVTQNQVFKL